MLASPRVAILTPYASSDFAGGVEVFNEQLARCLPGVQTFSLPRSVGSRFHWGLDSVGLEHPLRAWSVARRFLEEHRRHPFRLAICNGLYGWPLSALSLEIPVVQVYHYTLVGLARKGIAERGVRLHMEHVDGAFDRFAARRKHVVAVGTNVLDEVRRFYHRDGIVISNGVDTGLFTRHDRLASRTELGLPPDARIGLFVGRAEYTKGFDVLREIIRRSPDTRFILVGDCPDLGTNVAVHRRVPHERMPLFYSAADFFLLPSRYEGFNLAVLEALACGLPILVSRAAYALDESPRGLGAVVDSTDPGAYLAALERLPPASDGTSEREGVAARYSLERFRQHWRKKVSQLLADGS
jgi:glycosyltransferase involved in cell wall biosynthesis